jgi:ribonuclease HII
MPWVVGIDEAGYGPNLGPLVQAAVALHLPDDDPAGWETLRPVVRRCHEKDDGRLLIDDSKKVYTRGGLAALEAVAYSLFGVVPQTVESFLARCSPACLDDLRAECWFDPQELLPVDQPAEALPDVFGRWTSAYRTANHGAVASLIPPLLFNRVCDGSGSKATLLSCGLVSLLAEMWKSVVGGHPEHSADPITFHCDKHGGRNYYAALVQQAFPDGWVVTEVESAAESRYRVDHLDRPVTVTFRPRADAESVAVALASMLAKYLREVCMRQFNRFWAQHVPGLKPTAGYPGDAKRFYASIRDAMVKLGLTDEQVWRKK